MLNANATTALAMAAFTVVAAALGLTEVTVAGTAPGTGRPGFALATVFERLRACDRALAPAAVAFLTTADRRAVAERCGALAARVQALTPEHGFSAYIEAAAAEVLGNADIRDSALARSAAAAPAEGWLAERRTALARRGGVPASAADLAVLVTTQRGAEFLARAVLRDAGLAGQVRVAAAEASAAEAGRLTALIMRGATPG